VTSPTTPTERRCRGCGSLALAPGPCARCGVDPGAPGAGRRRGPVIGVMSPVRGIRFLSRNPRLWSWVVLPLVVNTILFGVIAFLTARHIGDWLPDFAEPWPAWIDWLRTGLGWVLEALLVVVGVLAAWFATLILAGIVNAPFYDRLSEAVESAYFERDDPGRPLSAFAGDVVRSLAAALSMAARYLLVMAVLFPLSFTAIGAPLFAVAGFYYAGLAQVDVPMARKLYPGRLRAWWGRSHLLLVVGLGVPISLVPLLAPFGIVGATLAFLDDPRKA